MTKDEFHKLARLAAPEGAPNTSWKFTITGRKETMASVVATERWKARSEIKEDLWMILHEAAFEKPDPTVVVVSEEESSGLTHRDWDHIERFIENKIANGVTPKA